MLPKVLLPGTATPTAPPDCQPRPSMLLKMPYQQGVLISLGKTKVKIGTNLQSISQAGGVFISFWRSPAKLGEKFQQKLWSAKQWDNTKDHCSLSLPMILLEMIENLICIYFPVFLLLHEVEYIFMQSSPFVPQFGGEYKIVNPFTFCDGSNLLQYSNSFNPSQSISNNVQLPFTRSSDQFYASGTLRSSPLEKMII